VHTVLKVMRNTSSRMSLHDGPTPMFASTEPEYDKRQQDTCHRASNPMKAYARSTLELIPKEAAYRNIPDLRRRSDMPEMQRHSGRCYVQDQRSYGRGRHAPEDRGERSYGRGQHAPEDRAEYGRGQHVPEDPKRKNVYYKSRGARREARKKAVSQFMREFFANNPEMEFVAHCGSSARFAWASYLERNQFLEEEEREKGATHKPLSMLELYRANPKPREEAMPWLRENIVSLIQAHERITEQCRRVLLQFLSWGQLGELRARKGHLGPVELFEEVERRYIVRKREEPKQQDVERLRKQEAVRAHEIKDLKAEGDTRCYGWVECGARDLEVIPARCVVNEFDKRPDHEAGRDTCTDGRGTMHFASLMYPLSPSRTLEVDPDTAPEVEQKARSKIDAASEPDIVDVGAQARKTFLI